MNLKMFFVCSVVAGSALSLSAAEGVINASTLNLRLRPELSSPVAMKLKKDTVVQVLAECGNFYEIAAPAELPVFTDAAGIGADGKLFRAQQLRVKPAGDAASYGIAPAGTVVETVSIDRYGWAKIKLPIPVKLYAAQFYVTLKEKLEKPAPVEVKKEESAPAPEVKKEEPAPAPVEVKKEESAPAPEVKKEEPAPEVNAEKKPILAPELLGLGIDAAKGEKVSAKGTLNELAEKDLASIQYALTAEQNGKLQILFFVSIPAGQTLESLEGKTVSMEGTAYSVPNWKNRVLLLDKIEEIKE